MAEDEKIRLPKYEYGTQEYKNTHKHWTWPDGTSIFINPEGESETLSVHHSSGGYFEFRSNGTSVQVSPNNHVMYQKGGLTMSVDNNGDVKMSGHGRINIDTDGHFEVAKNASIAVNGMAEIFSKGHVKFAAADISLASTKGSIVLHAARDVEIKASKGRVLSHSAGAMQLTTDSGDIHMEAGGKIVSKSKSDNVTDSGGKITEKGTELKSTISGSVLFQADGVITTKGSQTDVQGGGPTMPPHTVV